MTDDEFRDNEEVRRVGIETWLEAAAAEFCFREPGMAHGGKADADSYYACILGPGHDGDCVFGNAAMIESALATRRRIRKAAHR